jgi:hypothetical protein
MIDQLSVSSTPVENMGEKGRKRYRDFRPRKIELEWANFGELKQIRPSRP